MAKRFLLLLSPFLTTLLLAVTVTESEAYATTTTPYQGYKPEKFTHLHFYFHDVISGDKPTAIRVAEAPGTNSSAIKFGVIMIADDPLTDGPDPSSKEVGRAQGMYASTDLKDLIFTMVFNLAFTEGQFNGSTLAMYGRNAIMTKLREMPIIGGTGAFRFARGYAQAQTYKLVGQDAVVEYNVFIWH
ncbi:PREDICTED: dirigent protein 2-like [Camelina sativa]|uniref:Dirigent protein n=1 Tax=Camelina sativa TaxID=90675 RepID=A0ABM0UJS1_CAMSA|nr:PREDICTED: dirigent protein 2-like [Camelina sativa]XP_010442172.1 PREDICTED: dirigent protein 2-like [Camelina sativa]